MRRRIPRLFESPSDEEPSINLTPLIDVVFVLLITFMILAPILDIESIHLASAGPLSKKQSPAASPLAISIKANNTLWLRGKQVSLQELEAILLAEKKLHPHLTPQVIPEKQAPFGTYQDIKNLLEACGFEQMDIVLK